MTTAELTEKQYANRVDRIYERVLRQRIIDLLGGIRDDFTGNGYTADGPHDLSDDEYRWYIVVSGNGLSEDIDISVEVSESLNYEGTTDGINVGMSLTTYEGRIVGELQPYNFTPEVWTNDLHEISERMAILEGAASSTVEYVRNWQAAEGAPR